MPLVEHELITYPEHLNSTTVLMWLRVGYSLVVCVVFVDQCVFLGLYPWHLFSSLSVLFCLSVFLVLCTQCLYRLWLYLWFPSDIYFWFTTTEWPFGFIKVLKHHFPRNKILDYLIQNMTYFYCGSVIYYCFICKPFRTWFNFI